MDRTPIDILELVVLGAFALVAICSACTLVWTLVSWLIKRQLNQKLLGISALALCFAVSGFVIAGFGFELCFHMR